MIHVLYLGDLSGQDESALWMHLLPWSEQPPNRTAAGAMNPECHWHTGTYNLQPKSA